MVCLPFLFELLIRLLINILSFLIFVVFFHFGDATMFFHHFLEMASALCGRSADEVLCKGFENLTGS